MICGACGDKLALPGDPHECWVYTKLQEQETRNPDCGYCGKPETGGLAHRECHVRDISGFDALRSDL